MPNIKTYIPTWLLWEYIEHFNKKLELDMDEPMVTSTEPYRMFLLGRRSMIQDFIESIAEEEITFDEVKRREDD